MAISDQRRKQLQDRVREFEEMDEEETIDVPELTGQYQKDLLELSGIRVDPFRA